MRSRDVVFVEDQTIEDIVKTKGQVPPQQQQDLIDSDPVPAAPAPMQVEADAEDVQDDVHGGAGEEEDAPQQQQEYDAEVDDPDQQEAPAPESPPAAPLRRSNRGRIPSSSYPSDQYVVLLSDGSKPDTTRKRPTNGTSILPTNGASPVRH